MYKIEMHLHTKYASECGKMDAKEIVDAYLSAGFHGVVVTDHYNRRTHWHPRMRESTAETLWGFTEGYLKVLEAGEKAGLKVYRGAEIRFDENNNDYLLYNYPDSLLSDPEALFAMGLEKFYPLSKASGALLLQAHPFRDTCRPVCIPMDPHFLDGIEVCNANLHHDSHNDMALAMAEENPHLIRVSGSDCHRPEDVGLGGILCNTLPEDESALAALLRSGNYQLL